MPSEGARSRPAATRLGTRERSRRFGERRAIVENVLPQIDGGRFPIKRTPGETVTVTADAFADGHDVLAVVLLDRSLGLTPGASAARSPGDWRETEMVQAEGGTDEWTGTFAVETIGWHEYAIVAWVDRFRTWRHTFEIKARVGQDVQIELLEGSLIIREASAVADARGVQVDAGWLLSRADALTDGTFPLEDRVAAAVDAELSVLMFAYADRSRATISAPLRVRVDRERARYGSWYEFFPRSAGPDPQRSGTFADATALLPRIADLGFDVVYLPPIHPIGSSFRKGRNNSLVAAPGDPGSPWAIGSEAGGHEAVDPELGTVDDFLSFSAAAGRLGLEVALDLAWQCSPDHPWVTAHPEWFRHRPDGTIKYAENPPKKYQDIYPLDFECDDWRPLWRALLDVTLVWVQRGVRIFRVDNPHTKTLPFWEWLIGEVQTKNPDVIFLAEAFTRPKLMEYLAKSGFSQSYTYFTWRNRKEELTAYLEELTSTGMREYFRPNFFTNTPDILHAYLQHGGSPAFEARLLLAATLSASYGIYSGFELCEARAAGPSSEEYADSEKYQYRQRDWNAPGNINELIARVNAIRRGHHALQFNQTLKFHPTDNPFIIAYSKSGASTHDDRLREAILTIVNLDPHRMQHGWVDTGDFATDDGTVYTVTDLLDDSTYGWRGRWNYVRLDPGVRQGHIMAIGIVD